MSETSVGWFVTHGDGNVHGPYTLAALVQAAKLGNISAETQIRHPTLTQDEWLPAARLRGVAEAMKSPAAPAPASAPAPTAAPAPVTPPAANRPPVANAPPKSKPAPAMTAATGPAVAGTAAAGSSAAIAVDRRHRPRDPRPLLVPRTVGGAIIGLLDLRFRYFLTPWILSFVWGLAIVIAPLAIVGTTAAYLSLTPPAAERVSDTDTAARDDAVHTDEAGQWQFYAPTSWRWRFLPLLLYTGLVLSIIVALLAVRLVFEYLTVTFRIASDMSDIRENLKEE